MRAMLLTGFGGPEKLAYRTDVAVPIPKSGEVLVQVGACGVNNTDIWTREGAYGSDEQSGWQGGAFQFPRIQAQTRLAGSSKWVRKCSGTVLAKG